MVSADSTDYTYDYSNIRTSKTDSSFYNVNGIVVAENVNNEIYISTIGSERIQRNGEFYLYNIHGDVIQISRLKGGADYVEMTGDFSECVKRAQMYEEVGFKPKYNLFECNCTDYVQDLLSVAEIDNWGVNFAVKNYNPKTPRAYLWFIKKAY